MVFVTVGGGGGGVMVVLMVIIGSTTLSQTSLALVILMIVIRRSLVVVMMVPITRIGHRDHCQAKQAQQEKSRHGGLLFARRRHLGGGRLHHMRCLVSVVSLSKIV